MRVLVLGGTRFTGRRITERLVWRGDDVLIVHRGRCEPASWVSCRHLHVDRRDLGSVARQVRDFAPDAVMDTSATSATDTDAALAHLPRCRPWCPAWTCTARTSSR